MCRPIRSIRTTSAAGPASLATSSSSVSAEKPVFGWRKPVTAQLVPT